MPGERLTIADLSNPAHSELVTSHIDRYIFAACYVKDKIVIDAACGTGYGSNILATIGEAKKVFSYDIASEAIDEAISNFGHLHNVQIHASDICSGLGIGVANVFVSFETLEHIEDLDGYFNSVTSALLPGGIFIVSTPNRIFTSPGISQYERPCNPYHIFELNVYEFISMLKKHFVNIQLFGQSCAYPKLLVFRYATFPLRKLLKSLKIYQGYGLQNRIGNLIWNKVLNAPLHLIAVCQKSFEILY